MCVISKKNSNKYLYTDSILLYLDFQKWLIVDGENPQVLPFLVGLHKHQFVNKYLSYLIHIEQMFNVVCILGLV